MRRNDREVTGIKEIEEILLKCKTCHIAMIDDGVPYVVPLSYGYQILEGKTLELYFHSAAEGRKITALKRGGAVCFEISYEGEPLQGENPCSSGYYYASVIGLGEAVFIEDENEKCSVLSELVKHQTGVTAEFTADQTKSVCVFKIISKDFTGKKKPTA